MEGKQGSIKKIEKWSPSYYQIGRGKGFFGSSLGQNISHLCQILDWLKKTSWKKGCGFHRALWFNKLSHFTSNFNSLWQYDMGNTNYLHIKKDASYYPIENFRHNYVDILSLKLISFINREAIYYFICGRTFDIRKKIWTQNTFNTNIPSAEIP